MMDKISGADKLLIFTTVDNLFSDPEDPNYEKAIALIDNLRKLAIPLIAVSDKTNAQIQSVSPGLGWTAITEHGSGMFISQVDDEFINLGEIAESDVIVDKGWQVKQLGCTYVEARAALKVIQSVVRINNLKGFGDLDLGELERITGLDKSEIKQIKTRNFSEIFVTPKNVDYQEIITTAAEFGFKALMGEKLSCLVGESASVAAAVDLLKTSYERSQTATKVSTIGLGYYPIDLEMLSAVDVPIIISQNQSSSEPLDQDWFCSKASGLTGWVETITDICANYES